MQEAMDVEVSGQGTPLVAVHGIQGTRAAWMPVAHLLGHKLRFVLPNLRGRGNASRGAAPQDYALDRYADDLAAAINRHVGRHRYVLAGWSLGVSVALQYLSRPHAVRPAGLVLASGTPCLAQVRWFRGEGAALRADIAAREQRLGLTHAADHDAVARTWTAISASDQRPLLAGIDVPALVLHGRADDDCPWQHGAWLADGLPRACMVTIEAAGHGLLAQATARVAEAIERFTAACMHNEEVA